jgi:Mg2+ and Co2+ transporter CorA
MLTYEQLTQEDKAEILKEEEPGYRPKIELDKDYYAVTFCTFISYYKNRF